MADTHPAVIAPTTIPPTARATICRAQAHTKAILRLAKHMLMHQMLLKINTDRRPCGDLGVIFALPPLPDIYVAIIVNTPDNFGGSRRCR